MHLTSALRTCPGDQSLPLVARCASLKLDESVRESAASWACRTILGDFMTSERLGIVCNEAALPACSVLALPVVEQITPRMERLIALIALVGSLRLRIPHGIAQHRTMNRQAIGFYSVALHSTPQILRVYTNSLSGPGHAFGPREGRPHLFGIKQERYLLLVQSVATHGVGHLAIPCIHLLGPRLFGVALSVLLMDALLTADPLAKALVVEPAMHLHAVDRRERPATDVTGRLGLPAISARQRMVHVVGVGALR